MPNWIPTRDRLPPDEVLVRCRDANGNKFEAFYCSRVHSTCWFRNGRVCHPPTHWKPIKEAR